MKHVNSCDVWGWGGESSSLGLAALRRCLKDAGFVTFLLAQSFAVAACDARALQAPLVHPPPGSRVPGIFFASRSTEEALMLEGCAVAPGLSRDGGRRHGFCRPAGRLAPSSGFAAPPVLASLPPLSLSPGAWCSCPPSSSLHGLLLPALLGLPSPPGPSPSPCPSPAPLCGWRDQGSLALSPWRSGCYAQGLTPVPMAPTHRLGLACTLVSALPLQGAVCVLEGRPKCHHAPGVPGSPRSTEAKGHVAGDMWLPLDPRHWSQMGTCAWVRRPVYLPTHGEV